MPDWLKLMLLVLTAAAGFAAAGLGAVSSERSSARELPFAVSGLPLMLLLLLGPMMLSPDSWPEALTVICPDECCWLCC
jgi:hypothetical protein